jgi:hypothetical protein
MTISRTPTDPWERLAGSVAAAADQLEGFLVALQAGDAARARRLLDASRDERARGQRLQAEAEAFAPEPGSVEVTARIRRQLGRIALGDQVLGAVLPALPEGPNGSERFVDQQIDRVWDLGRDVIILVGPVAPRHAAAFRARGYRRVISVSDQGEHHLRDLERALLALREDPPGRFVCLAPGAREAFANRVRELAALLLPAFVLEASFAERWAVTRVSHCVQNLPILARSWNLSDLGRPFAGRTALIVCPGPSLDGCLDLIAAHRDRFVVFAVNHALRNLAARGICPDFAVALDPGPHLVEHFQHVDTARLAGLVICPSIAPSIVRLPGVRRVIHVNFNGPPEAWLDPLLGRQTEVETGGTVAHGAAAVAVRLGCQALVFVGQDLAYRGRQLYASDTVHGSEVDVAEGDGLAVEGGIRRGLAHVAGWSGERLATSTQFDSYRRWYEQWIPTKAGVRFINCSEGGARIKGMTHVPLATALTSLPAATVDVEALLATSAQRSGAAVSAEGLKVRCAERLGVLGALTAQLHEALTACAVAPGETSPRQAEPLLAAVLRRVSPGDALAAPELAFAFEHARRTLLRARADARGDREVLAAFSRFLGDGLTICQTLTAAWTEARALLAEAAGTGP